MAIYKRKQGNCEKIEALDIKNLFQTKQTFLLNTGGNNVFFGRAGEERRIVGGYINQTMYWQQQGRK